MYLDEEQLDRIIQNTAQELGWGQHVLDKLGVSRPKRQAIQRPPNDYRWSSPISYYYDNIIRMLLRYL